MKFITFKWNSERKKTFFGSIQFERLSQKSLFWRCRLVSWRENGILIWRKLKRSFRVNHARDQLHLDSRVSGTKWNRTKEDFQWLQILWTWQVESWNNMHQRCNGFMMTKIEFWLLFFHFLCLRFALKVKCDCFLRHIFSLLGKLSFDHVEREEQTLTVTSDFVEGSHKNINHCSEDHKSQRKKHLPHLTLPYRWEMEK